MPGDPAVGLFQRGVVQAAVAALTVPAPGDQPGVLEHLEVARDRRLGEGKLFDQFPDRKLTARENLEVFAGLYSGKTRKPMDLLEMVGLTDAADQRVAQFSKGMQMRLNFARALLNEPELLFLDEPTGGLDPLNARRIKEIIVSERARGTSVFLTTHDMMVADSLCDRVAFIVDGELPVIDAPRELKLRHGARNVRVFGSWAQGHGGRDSDLDLIVELEPGRDLLDLIGLKQALEDDLNIQVDVLTEDALSPYLRDDVLRSAKAL